MDTRPLENIINLQNDLIERISPERKGRSGEGRSFTSFFSLAVALVFSGIVELGIGILPGHSANLAPFRGADDAEVFHIGGAALGCEVNVQQCSANAEEHTVLVDGIEVEADILEVCLGAQGGDAVDILVGGIRDIQTNAAAQPLEHDAVRTDLVGIFSLETVQFDFNGFTDLQNNSPFSFVDFRHV